MTGVEDMNLSVQDVLAVPFGLNKIEREVVLTPNHQQARLLFAHPCLPLWIRVYISSVIVEQIALNLRLSWLVQKGKFIGPEIRIIAFHVRIVPHMACPRCLQR